MSEEPSFPLSPEILAGDTSDVYFLRTNKVMELEGVNPRVTMEVFPSGDGILCGMREIEALLRECLPSEGEVWALAEGETFRAKEVVLRSNADPRLEKPLEQFVEVAAFADRNLSRRGRRRSGKRGSPES